MARAKRFRSEKDRRYWMNARLTLRTILGACTGESPAALRFVCNENGKPALDSRTGIDFNLSHAGDFALVAVSTSGPVGVDIERMRLDVEIAVLLRRLGETDLPETIPELYHRWTQREARSKAVGAQLFVAPPPGVYAVDIPAPDGYAASVAALRTPISIVLRA
jgi:4'-phosphopantetheinyl transferase